MYSVKCTLSASRITEDKYIKQMKNTCTQGSQELKGWCLRISGLSKKS